MSKATLLIALLGLGLFGARPSLALGQVATILAFGDSLTAGYGLTSHQAYPEVLQEMLRAEGLEIRVVNAGVSGETTAGGRARLGRYLKTPPQAVILELGTNDALMGASPERAEANLAAMLEELTSRGIKVILTGGMAPGDFLGRPNQAFNAIYPRLAQRFGVESCPDFMAEVWSHQHLTMDGLHPTAEGARIMAQGIYPLVKRLMRSPAAP